MATIQELQDLAILYIQKHATEKDSADSLLKMYSEALEALKQANQSQNKPVERRSLLG